MKTFHLDIHDLDKDQRSKLLSIIIAGGAFLENGSMICVPVNSMRGPPPADIADFLTQRFCDVCHTPVYAPIGVSAPSYTCGRCAAKSDNDQTAVIFKPTGERMDEALVELLGDRIKTGEAS